MSTSASIPCFQAYALAATSLSFGTIAAVLALTAFIRYVVTFERTPTRRFSSNSRFDIESASWVLILTSIGALATTSATVSEFLCGQMYGTACTSATIQCYSQTGTAAAAAIATFSSAIAATFKILSQDYQLKHPPTAADLQQLSHIVHNATIVATGAAQTQA